jgi:hypothetical protein
MESTWSPCKLLQNSMEAPWTPYGLQGYMWLSVTTSQEGKTVVLDVMGLMLWGFPFYISYYWNGWLVLPQS